MSIVDGQHVDGEHVDGQHVGGQGHDQILKWTMSTDIMSTRGGRNRIGLHQSNQCAPYPITLVICHGVLKQYHILLTPACGPILVV